MKSYAMLMARYLFQKGLTAFLFLGGLVKHIKARFDSTCIACLNTIKQGEIVVLMHTQDFKNGDIPKAGKAAGFIKNAVKYISNKSYRLIKTHL